MLLKTDKCALVIRKYSLYKEKVIECAQKTLSY